MGSNLILEEPFRLASILEPSSQPKSFAAMTKIVGTLGASTKSQEIIESLLNAGMTVARFDFSQGDLAYHQETLKNLQAAIKKTKKLCAVMMDTKGIELLIQNKSGDPIYLVEGAKVVITGDTTKESSADVLPLNYSGLAKDVEVGSTIFVGQYLFTGSETTSVYLDVVSIDGGDVTCSVRNSATLQGKLFTAHVAKIHISRPTITEEDEQDISQWGQKNGIDFLAVSFTRSAEDIKQAKALLRTLGDLYQTQVFAKIENLEGLMNFDEILEEADGIVLSRGNLGIDIPSEKVFLFQKAVLCKCNLAGKPAVITRVVDTMTDTPRPTRAEATDVANAVLDGADAIMLGAETRRGLYPVEAVSTVKFICSEAEKVFNQELYFKNTVKFVGEPMSQLESITSSAVRAAVKVRATCIVVFSSSGRAARLIAKYRPTMPVLVIVIPRLSTNQLKWSLTGAYQARQCLIMRGLFPMMADPRQPAEPSLSGTETILKVALDHGKAAGLVKAHDRVVICQKLGDSAVVKIIDYEG